MRDYSPLFSVLIANYNNGCFLRECIESVIVQSYPHWEIIIVDDASSDGSDALYEEFSRDSRIHVVSNERNMGAGFTKRRCVENANGEICGFLDPDDLLAEPDAIEMMVSIHQQNPNASMVYSGFYSMDENLNLISVERGMDLGDCSGLESYTWPFKHFVSFKKELYNRTIGIDPLMKRAVDYDMYYKLEEVGDVVHLDSVLYKYRQNANSISLNDGEYKSRAWHVYACVEAMKRRGLTEERLMLFPIEDALRRAFNKGVEHGKNTKTYRVGEFVLKPFKFLGGRIKKDPR